MGWIGSDCHLEMHINTANQIGYYRPTHKNPKDIFVKFPNWPVKPSILEVFKEPSVLSVDGSKITLLPDLIPITLQKRKDLKFITSMLQQLNIKYAWQFSFKLVIAYDDSIRIIVKTIQEAKEFHTKITANNIWE